jgi:hypothetical protein
MASSLSFGKYDLIFLKSFIKLSAFISVCVGPWVG